MRLPSEDDITEYVWPADELARFNAYMAGLPWPPPERGPGPPSFDDVVAENLRRGLYLSSPDPDQAVDCASP